MSLGRFFKRAALGVLDEWIQWQKRQLPRCVRCTHTEDMHCAYCDGCHTQEHGSRVLCDCMGFVAPPPIEVAANDDPLDVTDPRPTAR